MTIVTGTRLGRYEIRSKIGAGGMGEVYLAEDTQLGRRVAIKLLPPETISDDHARKRLVREARAAATLDHPHICSVYEVGEADGRSFIAMQYIEGETLDTRMKRKPLDLSESLSIAAQVADALAEAHGHGIIHRDIKPSNIMNALAYVGMGNGFKSLGGVYGYASPRAAAPQGKASIMKALAIDEKLADAHAALADFKLYYDWDWPGAEREYKRAIELNPNQASAHGGYGTYLQALGRFDEAVAERERSRQLDPTSPGAIANVGYPLYYARRFDQALEYYRKALELEPGFSWGHLWIGQVYVQQGKYGEAVAEIKRAIALSDGNSRDIGTLGHAYAVAGKRTEALKVLADLQERAKQKYVSPYFIALIYAGLGEKDQTFALLEKAYEERHPYLTLIKVEPVFDSLHSDSRFQDLTRRVGLPQ